MRSLSDYDLERWGVSYYETMEIACRNLDETTIALATIGDHFHSSFSGDNYRGHAIEIHWMAMVARITGSFCVVILMVTDLCLRVQIDRGGDNG